MQDKKRIVRGDKMNVKMAKTMLNVGINKNDCSADVNRALEVAKSALDMQIPSETKYCPDFKSFYCKCGHKIQLNQRYCDDCGQRQQWNGVRI